MNTQSKYRAALDNLPPAGEGLGFHQTILSVANHGVNAGVDPQQIFDDIRQHIRGGRRVPDREIWQAIDKALADKGVVPFITTSKNGSTINKVLK